MHILCVMAYPPFPLDVSGGAIRSRALIDALAQCGKVSILYLNYRGKAHRLTSVPNMNGEAPVAVHTVDVSGSDRGRIALFADKCSRALGMLFGRGLAETGIRVSSAAKRAIADLADRGEVDLVVARHCRAAAVAGVLESCPAPLLIDADDWDPDNTRAQLRWTPKSRPLARFVLQKKLSGNIALVDQALTAGDHVWSASEAPTNEINKAHLTTLPNIPLDATGREISPVSPSRTDARTLFAVGNWVEPYNAEGMQWYLQKAWPLIQSRAPETRLRIAGNAPAALANWWRNHPNVSVLGFVRDIAPEYENAALVVTSMNFGGGTKLKVLEALAYGRIPTGPTHGFEGLTDQQRLADVVVADDDPEVLAEKTVSLIASEDTRHNRERLAVEYLKEHYSLTQFNALVQETVSRLGGTHTPSARTTAVTTLRA